MPSILASSMSRANASQGSTSGDKSMGDSMPRASNSSRSRRLRQGRPRRSTPARYGWSRSAARDESTSRRGQFASNRFAVPRPHAIRSIGGSSSAAGSVAKNDRTVERNASGTSEKPKWPAPRRTTRIAPGDGLGDDATADGWRHPVLLAHHHGRRERHAGQPRPEVVGRRDPCEEVEHHLAIEAAECHERRRYALMGRAPRIPGKRGGREIGRLDVARRRPPAVFCTHHATVNLT